MLDFWIIFSVFLFQLVPLALAIAIIVSYLKKDKSVDLNDINYYILIRDDLNNVDIIYYFIDRVDYDKALLLFNDLSEVRVRSYGVIN